jgi:hypothetical protein
LLIPGPNTRPDSDASSALDISDSGGALGTCFSRSVVNDPFDAALAKSTDTMSGATNTCFRGEMSL